MLKLLRHRLPGGDEAERAADTVVTPRLNVEERSHSLAAAEWRTIVAGEHSLWVGIGEVRKRA